MMTHAEMDARYLARQRGEMAPFVPQHADLYAHGEMVGACLEWQRSTDGRSQGYGKVWRNGGMVGVHRISLEKKLGRPLLPDMMALHTCDNRRCFLKEHLFEGTAQQNVDDMMDKGRAGWLRAIQSTRKLEAA